MVREKSTRIPRFLQHGDSTDWKKHNTINRNSKDMKMSLCEGGGRDKCHAQLRRVVTKKWPLHGGTGALSATSSAASLEL